MAGISRNTLHWQSIAKIFIGSLVSGLSVLFIAAWLVYSSLDNALTGSDIAIYFGLCAALLIIIAGLWAIYAYHRLARPLEALEQITSALPLLSAKKYQEANEIFQRLESATKHQEIIDLQHAGQQLTEMLAQLDSNIEQRSKQINAKSEELRVERDFIKSLMDTAQLIILTVNEKFEITLFNEHGAKLTGFQEAELLNTDVARMFPAGNWTEAQTCFNELLAGNLRIAQQDAELVDKYGVIKQISWLHSRLENNNNDAVILSVGLDMTAKSEAEKRVIWMAEHDPLTDLCNRRKFTEEFEKSLRTAIRYHHNNTLLYLDLDQFKDINDTSGHKAGDELLVLVGKTLKRVTRFTDLVARLGGDEFAILMPESDDEGAQVLAHKILKELSTLQLEYGAVRHKISASIGIVHFPLHDASIHELLTYADLAMYQAKQNGKSDFHVFSADDQTRQELESRVYWKHQIEDALENHNFLLYFQPILELKSNNVEHYEVLIRMHHPETGDISLPGKFIEVAEQVGLIREIDQWVINISIKKLAELHKKGIKARFSINLSASIIDAPMLLPLLKKLIKKYEIDPATLIFEVTETVAVSNLQKAKAMMLAIKALGCQFSLDDFGVGFSSFNYMRELPVDIIKIDGIFIKDLDKNADDQLFVKALVDVAKGLGRKTIAEFVENHAVLTLLRTYGVDFAQGYYVGKPSPKILTDSDWHPPETH
ncbi:putative bifunctional diguanylate cyclase/phosphodiesterase [Methylophaga sp. OBS3]|uniref:putative bifunctional diguanylate cyclase/phosphodiesterase n=1 Tax=Methylophaga sp. OBS3 TaxID=2991934 RepID=UPI002250089F|nr:EAL domain-containing protein [Methylophaga sp. OBS3]MCX4190722.1 EAL domain-containing protein [Methylophaga sp. OBS3]